MKLALGTVQFGLAYGVSNVNGVTPLSAVRAILKTAASAGIKTIDTAPSYGVSEEVLGQANCKKFEVISKSPKASRPEKLKPSVERSLELLKVDRLKGLLFHDPAQLIKGDKDHWWNAALKLKNEGLIESIGVSVYDSDEIDLILSRFPIDLIQVPLSILDQRLLKSGHLQLLKSQGVDIHVRSAFLQGLLLMPPQNLDPYFDPIKTHLESFHRFCHSEEITPVAACLNFLLELKEVDSIICGVNSLNQLEELIKAAREMRQGFSEKMRLFAWDDPNILNPSRWRLTRR